MLKEPYQEAIGRFFQTTRKSLVIKAINEVEKKITSIKNDDSKIIKIKKENDDLVRLSKNLIENINGKAKKRREVISEMSSYLKKLILPDSEKIKLEAVKALNIEEIKKPNRRANANRKRKRRLAGKKQSLQGDTGSLSRLRKHDKDRSGPQIQQQSMRGSQPIATSYNSSKKIHQEEARRKSA